jgi:hypothetical protein
VNDEFETIWKEAAVAILVCFEELRRATKNLIL